ncbi:hypothetical protein CEXT_788361, partial [Caerostris extrusa]
LNRRLFCYHAMMSECSLVLRFPISTFNAIKNSSSQSLLSQEANEREKVHSGGFRADYLLSQSLILTSAKKSREGGF